MMQRQNGNVLFLILIAVALFAALSYAVTSSTRSGGGNPDKEKMALLADNMLNYSSTIRTAIMRLKMNGCSDEQISFETPLHWWNYANPNAPVSKKCHVFDPAGGNVAFQQTDKMFTAYWGHGVDTGSVEHFYALSDIPQIGKNCATADCADLYMVFQLLSGSTIGPALCKAINEQLKMDATWLPYPTISATFAVWPPFVGTYANLGYPFDPLMNGHNTGCFVDGNGNFQIFTVLIER